MLTIQNRWFDQERALYGSEDLLVKSCSFAGPADGESAFKESRGVRVEQCLFDLRYPFWHNGELTIIGSEMTGLCRAALWYSDHIEITGTKLHGIKALRECSQVVMRDCDIVSPEFGWSVRGGRMENCTAQGEYFMLRSKDLAFSDLRFQGKYSFQYVQNAVLDHCELDTKDAFWHSQNVTVRNSVVKGEYLGWYSENLTLIDCRIVGTQPLCYCKSLKLVNCEMIGADLCFEKSEVDAVIATPVISIKNPLSGCIRVPSVEEIIRDDASSQGEIVIQLPAGDKSCA